MLPSLFPSPERRKRGMPCSQGSSASSPEPSSIVQCPAWPGIDPTDVSLARVTSGYARKVAEGPRRSRPLSRGATSGGFLFIYLFFLFFHMSLLYRYIAWRTYMHVRWDRFLDPIGVRGGVCRVCFLSVFLYVMVPEAGTLPQDLCGVCFLLLFMRLVSLIHDLWPRSCSRCHAWFKIK